MTAARPLVSPHAEYQARLAARRAEEERLGRAERRLSNARLAVFAAGLGVAWLVFGRAALAGAWLAAPIAGFLALVVAHDRVITRRRRAARAAAFYERGLARLEHRFAGSGESGERFADPAHPYAGDLDLFGPGSLFELLCAARTRGGEETLAAWLLGPAPPDVVRERQTAVAELRPRLDLREALALLGGDVRAGVDPETLLAWAGAPPAAIPRAARPLAAALAGTAALAAILLLASDAGPLPLVVALAGEGVLAALFHRRVSTMLRGVEKPGRDLGLLAELLARLEAERFSCPLLARLRAALESAGAPPSREVARLRRRIELLDARRNQLFAPIAGLLLWGTQLGLAIEAWRVRCGPAVARWIAALGEVEALSSLAGHAFEHPEDPFPEIVEGGPRLAAEGLGHPLLPEARCVRNDLGLDGEHRLLVVSGSNMSGKSTLLRTAGVNVVLALAGGTVRARRLLVSPLAVGASVRVVDSLQEGRSRFYAEIRRLRALVDLAQGPLPLLFLLDEILSGTNSHDRRIGAEAVVRGFLARGAVGLVTTHDLALAEIADALAPRAANVHFEDHLEQGEVRFDYRLRPGVVRKSNALELMRAVGLEVAEGA